MRNCDNGAMIRNQFVSILQIFLSATSTRRWDVKLIIRPTTDTRRITHYFCCFNVFGRPYYRSRLWYSMSSVSRLSVCLSVVCDVLYPGKTAGPICMKFSGKVWTDHGTTWLHFGQFGETARCRDTNFFVSNIPRKRLDRFAWNFQGRCGVIIRRPVYILCQFG